VWLALLGDLEPNLQYRRGMPVYALNAKWLQTGRLGSIIAACVDMVSLVDLLSRIPVTDVLNYNLFTPSMLCSVYGVYNWNMDLRSNQSADVWRSPVGQP
jgi:hypothetical protein